MKTKHLILPFIPAILLSCSNQKSNQVDSTVDSSKAPIEAIKEPNIIDRMIEVATGYLKQNLPDFNSYEAIEWSKVDTVYGDYATSNEAIQFKKTMDSLSDIIDQTRDIDRKYISIEYLQEKLNVILSFKKQDSIDLTRIDNANHKLVLEQNISNYSGQIDSIGGLIIKYTPIFNERTKLLSSWSKMNTQYTIDCATKKSNTIVGYRIDHKFRANNTNGIVNIGRLRIFTNPNYQVVKTIDLDVADRQVQEFNNAFGGLVN